MFRSSITKPLSVNSLMMRVPRPQGISLGKSGSLTICPPKVTKRKAHGRFSMRMKCAGFFSVVNMTYSGVRPSLPSPGVVTTITSPLRPVLSPPACNWSKFHLSRPFSRYTPNRIVNPVTKKMAPPMASQANLEMPRALTSCISKAKPPTNNNGPTTRPAHLMIRWSATTPSSYHTLRQVYKP